MRTSTKLFTQLFLLSTLTALLYVGSTSEAQESGSLPDDELTESSRSVAIYFIDEPGGSAAIIDIGPHEIIVDGGARADALRNFLGDSSDSIVDGPIELVVCTRNSPGNFVGLKHLFESNNKQGSRGKGASFQVLEFWEPGFEWPLKKESIAARRYHEFLDVMKKQVPAKGFKRPLEQFHSPASMTKELKPFKLDTIPEATFFVLHSDRNPQVPAGLGVGARSLYAVNNSSIVFMIEVEGLRILFGGSIWGKSVPDAASIEPKFVERDLLAFEAQHPGALKADLLLAPFSGSESANTQKFIEAVSPKFVIFNANPRVFLPRSTVVKRYERTARVFSTGVHKEKDRDHIVCSKKNEDDQRNAGSGSGQSISNVNCGYINGDSDDEWNTKDIKGETVYLSSVLNAVRELSANPDDDLFKGADLAGIDLHGRKFRRGIDLSGTDLSWSNLSGTDLTKVRLFKARLEHSFIDSNTILNEADLREVDFSSAKQPQHLQGADLSRATLGEVDLSKANLTGTNLSGVDLSLAKISKTLHGTILSEAVLNGADLRGASLIGVKLDGVKLQNADLTGAQFEPLPGFVPHINELVTADYLTTLTFERSPHALVELREAFKRAGLRQQERELTYAIERGRNSKRGPGEYWFNRILFDFPSQYGLSPNRPLIILAGAILLFAVPYTMALFTSGTTGIWAVWMPERIDRKDGETNDAIRLTSNYRLVRRGRLKGIQRWSRALFIGIYFSVVSAFQIGYRDLNVGSWISRIQSREYTLRATGWVRVVSGIQSLISVYLVALWLLTYFGRPFD